MSFFHFQNVCCCLYVDKTYRYFLCSMLGSVNLTTVSVKGVAAALEKHTPKGESKGIKAHFRMDENGILNLEKVRYTHVSFL